MKLKPALASTRASGLQFYVQHVFMKDTSNTFKPNKYISMILTNNYQKYYHNKVDILTNYYNFTLN